MPRQLTPTKRASGRASNPYVRPSEASDLQRSSVPPANSPGASERKLKIPRPMNCFMIFRKENYEATAAKLAAEKVEGSDDPESEGSKAAVNQTEVSPLVAAVWRGMTEEEKAPYREKAKQGRAKHALKHPNFVYNTKQTAQAPEKKLGARSSRSSPTARVPASSAQDSNTCHTQAYFPLLHAHHGPDQVTPTAHVSAPTMDALKLSEPANLPDQVDPNSFPYLKESTMSTSMRFVPASLTMQVDRSALTAAPTQGMYVPEFRSPSQYQEIIGSPDVHSSYQLVSEQAPMQSANWASGVNPFNPAAGNQYNVPRAFAAPSTNVFYSPAESSFPSPAHPTAPLTGGVNFQPWNEQNGINLSAIPTPSTEPSDVLANSSYAHTATGVLESMNAGYPHTSNAYNGSSAFPSPFSDDQYHVGAGPSTVTGSKNLIMSGVDPQFSNGSYNDFDTTLSPVNDELNPVNGCVPAATGVVGWGMNGFNDHIQSFDGYNNFNRTVPSSFTGGQYVWDHNGTVDSAASRLPEATMSALDFQLSTNQVVPNNDDVVAPFFSSFSHIGMDNNLSLSQPLAAYVSTPNPAYSTTAVEMEPAPSLRYSGPNFAATRLPSMGVPY